jgi:hypothetical protein
LPEIPSARETFSHNCPQTTDYNRIISVFAVYLMTLPVAQDCTASNKRMIVNNDLERMWSETVVA